MILLKTNENQAPSIGPGFFENDNFFFDRRFERDAEESDTAIIIKENAREFNIVFAAPGFNKNDFEINVEENDILTISAAKKEGNRVEKEPLTREEFSCYSLSHSFTLPHTVNAEKIDAKYNDGILKLSIPKKEETKVHHKKRIVVA